MPAHVFSFHRHAVAAACAAAALMLAAAPAASAANGQSSNPGSAAAAVAAGGSDKAASIKPERVRIDVSKAEVGVPPAAAKGDNAAAGKVSLPAKVAAAEAPAPTSAPTPATTPATTPAPAAATAVAKAQPQAQPDAAPAAAKSLPPAPAAAAAPATSAAPAQEPPPAGSMEAVVERLQQRLGASRGANGAVKVVTRQPGDLEMSVPERPPQRRARPAQHASRATSQRASRAPEHGSVALAAAHDGGAASRAHEAAAVAAKAHDKPAAAHAANAARGTHAGAAHWSYDGEHGPAAWGAMKPEFAICATGSRQSPIDIRGGVAVDLEPIKFDYRSTNFGVVDNGHTIQVNVGAGNSIEVMGRRYELAQFHFHRPSEERIDGRQFDMVAHLVHKSLEGQLAVVAVLLERGAAFAQIQQVWNNLPLEKNTEQRALQPLDMNQLLPAERRYYTYMGSLTTPPCSEGVLWMVMQQPLSLSPQQLDAFARIYPMNARPLQANAGRLIKQSN